MKLNRTVTILGIILGTLFMVGAVFYWLDRQKAIAQKEELIKNGIESTATIMSLNAETNMDINGSGGTRYDTDYTAEVSYSNTKYTPQNPGSDEFTAIIREEFYGNKNEPKANDTIKDQYFLRATFVIGNKEYNEWSYGDEIPIIYLHGQPNSVRRLDENGEVMDHLNLWVTYALLAFSVSFFIIAYFYNKGIRI